MDKTVKPGEISGKLPAPPSKSMSIRAVAGAALSRSDTLIRDISYCDDAAAAMNIAESLGAVIEINGSSILVRGGIRETATEFKCRESGLCMRLFMPVAGLYDHNIKMLAKGTLKKRPVREIADQMHKMGCPIITEKNYPPVEVPGKINAGDYEIDASNTSQFLSGLLYAMPLLDSDSMIVAQNLKSMGYIDMTIDMLAEFGIEIKQRDSNEFHIAGKQKYLADDITVEADWSSAAYMLSAAAINGELTIEGLSIFSHQPDKAVIQALSDAGAEVHVDEDFIKVKSNVLKAFEFDAAGSPDLIPALAALATSCNGRSVIRGATRLRGKESDRAKTITGELSKLGADIELTGDEIRITGRKLIGGTAESHNDHRIAMCLAIAAINSETDVVIRGAEAVSKSYPDFFIDLDKILS